MQTEDRINVNGTTYQILRMNLEAGKKYLVSNGYEQCRKVTYYQKDKDIWHYNSLLQLWLNS